MNWQVIKNNFRKNKLLNFSIFVFMAAAGVLFAVTICLFVQLTGSISHLMSIAKTPDFLQMHAGSIDEIKIYEFADGKPEVTECQINTFLNLDSALIYLEDNSLAGSSQDNGVCVQSKRFDYLVDMKDELVTLQPGEIGVPVCYMRQYQLKTGDTVTIADKEFEIVSFIRDSQMNSMMASSKRFLVCREDYDELMEVGTEEYLIEFLLSDEADISVFSTEYAAAGLPGNGPCITAGLIRMMNALSDGIMIMIILFVSVLVLTVALVCIRFIVLTGLEHDRKEIGMLKALGISKKDIRKLYFSKYIVIAAIADTVGICIAMLLKKTLGSQIEELYGNSQNEGLMILMATAGAIFISAITLFSIWRMLKRTEALSALKALFDMGREKKKKQSAKNALPVILLAAASAMLMVVPANLLSTISAPEFVTYMGIGNSEIRMDIRQCEDIGKNASEMSSQLTKDSRVEAFVRLDTISTKVRTEDSTEINIMAEYGDHTIFPVSYSKGSAPVKKNEIALSMLNAKDLGLDVGDKIEVITETDTEFFEICGIYSDITNGGKTAKIASPYKTVNESKEIMWSIFYVSLKDNADKNQWLEEYKALTENGMGMKVSDIASYVQATFGQTIEQIHMASVVAVIVAAGILFVVLLLFVRLRIARDRSDISLYKALGFRSKEAAFRYKREYACGVLLGILSGEILGFFAGSKLAGIMLRSLGADGFRFILNLPNVLVVIPLVIIVVCAIAVYIGVYEIKNIKPAECVTGR